MHPAENITFEKKDNIEDQVKKIQFLAEKLQMNPAVLGKFGQELFSFDAASIFTLVKNKEKSKLAKLGWGEFCKDSFMAPVDRAIYPTYSEKDKPRAIERLNNLRNIPGPIYCVKQSDSFLSDEKTRELMETNPEEYLTQKALFSYYNGEVVANSRVAHVAEEDKKKEFPVISADANEIIEYLGKI